MRGGRERLPWRDTDMQRWGDVCIMNGRIRDCRIPDPFAQNLIPSPFISYSGRATPRHVTASRVSNRRLRASHYRTYAQSTSETFGHLLIRRFNLFPSPQQHVCFTTKLFSLRPNPPRKHYSCTLTHYSTTLLAEVNSHIPSLIAYQPAAPHARKSKHLARLGSKDNSHLVPASHLGVSSHHYYHNITSN